MTAHESLKPPSVKDPCEFSSRPHYRCRGPPPWKARVVPRVARKETAHDVPEPAVEVHIPAERPHVGSTEDPGDTEVARREHVNRQMFVSAGTPSAPRVPSVLTVCAGKEMDVRRRRG